MKAINPILAILFTALSLLSCTFVHAQEAKKLFVAMPDSLLPLLTANNRADCVDFIESKMKAHVENRFGTKSEMTELGKDYVRMQITPQNTWQMKLLPVNDSTQVICTIQTVCAPACDSRLQFYTTDWKPLATADFITLPAMDDFLSTPDSASMHAFETARRSADMLLVKVDAGKENNELLFTWTTLDYMSTETAEKLMPFLRRSFSYQWKSGVFTK